MKWKIDLAHSSLEFAVRHMVISTVRGSFTDFTADVEIDDSDMTKSRGTITVNAASLDTRESRRDAHLRSSDFFDVGRFPTLTYTVTSIDDIDNGKLRINGDLTIRGITQSVALTAEARGPAVDPFGVTRLGLSAQGQVNRHDFGLDWNMVSEAGGLLVGDEVRISLEAEFTNKETEPSAD